MMMKIANRVMSEGKGRPVVLVNAFPVDGRMWEACAREMIRAADEAGMAPLTIWAPDMPGSGLSPVPGAEESGPMDDSGAYPEALDRMVESYVDLVHAAGYDQAVWVGLSMGGYLVMDLWRRHPEAVAALALCDTMAASDGTGGAARITTAEALERTKSVEPVMHFAEPQDGDSSVKKSQGFCNTMCEWIMGQQPEGCAWRQRMTAGRPDLTDVPGTITVPCAVISGELDPSSNPSVMKPLAENIGRQAVFTAIPDCGHFSAVEHPDVVAGALTALRQRVR